MGHTRTFVFSGFFCTAMVLGGLPEASAQQASANSSAPLPSSSTPTLSVDARLVNLPVVVRDKKGALVQNLTKEDFTLQVDGHPQSIRYFDIDKDLPLT